MNRVLDIAGWLAFLAVTPACGGVFEARETRLAAPITSERARCQASGASTNPLVTEWPASEKAHLESLASRAAVGVAYTGCDLEVIDACPLAGRYAFHRTTLASDTIEVGSVDELWAKLPIGAASLQGELARSQRLAVETTVSGQLALEGFDAVELDKTPACARVTHVVTSVSIGAFRLVAGERANAAGGASAFGVGAKADTTDTSRVVRTAGVAARCEGATDDSPHRDCASPIQVFLRPVTPMHVTPSSSSDAATTAPRGPASAAAITIAFPAPSDLTESWTLHDDAGAQVCRLPCTGAVSPGSGHYIERAESGGQGTRLDIPARLPFDPGTEAVATYRAERGMPFLSKLTFYGLGIPAAVGGSIALGFALAGSGQDGHGDDLRGFLFGASGLYLGTAIGTYAWFAWSHDAKLELLPSRPNVTGAVYFGPGFVSGRF